MTTTDLNKLFPAPTREGLHEDSPEAIIQDVLKVAARNGGAWLLGRHTFYEALLKGALIKDAVFAAVTAAAKDSQNPQRRIKAGMDKYDEMYPEYTDESASHPAPKSGKRGLLTDLVAAFGSRRPVERH